eukprot:3035774-Rhodomonas_salina.7
MAQQNPAHMRVQLVRGISSRSYVARRLDVPAVFMLDFAAEPVALARGGQKLPVETSVAVAEFDWARKSFPAVEWCVQSF